MKASYKNQYMKIAILLPSHWEAVRKIYEEGIATGNATFQTSVPSWEEWNNTHSLKPRLVAIDNATVLGWAAITPVSGRCVYAGVGEVSIYISTEARGRGIGKQLLAAAENYAKQNNCTAITMTVISVREELIAWYERHGYRGTGETEPFPTSPAFGLPKQPLHFIVMEKPI